MTRDIDLVMEIHRDDVSRLAQKLGDAYYFDEDMALAAITRESMFNLLQHWAEQLVLSRLLEEVRP